MQITRGSIKLNTSKRFEFIDLTEQIQDFISDNKLKDGQLLVYSKHTTLAIRVNEKESGIFKDAEEFFCKLLPSDKYYAHNDFDIRTENLVCSGECENGDSHLMHLLFGASETLLVTKGELELGTWQRVLAMELDGPRQNREIVLSFVGETGEKDAS